jgi:hypothetical protein
MEGHWQENAGRSQVVSLRPLRHNRIQVGHIPDQSRGVRHPGLRDRILVKEVVAY